VSSRGTDSDGAVGALVAVSRLLAATTDGDPEDIHATIVGEACECFGAAGAVLVAQEPRRRLRVLGGGDVSLDAHPLLAEMLDRRLRLVRPEPSRADELAGLVPDPAGAVMLLLRSPDRLDGVLLLHGAGEVDAEVATAFADAAAAALDRLRTVEEHERVVRQQQALTRAAKSLNESLDLETVLARICAEAVKVMDAEFAVVYRGSAEEPLVLTAGHGVPPEAVGWEMPRGAGLAGKVVLHGRAMLTNDFQRIAELPEETPLPADVTSAMAAPMEWDGELRGVLSVGYVESRPMTQADLAVLETVAELAASACANASAHAGLAHVARTDGLTGCLNHAALHDGLAKEIERALRGDHPPLSLILIDLDDFKQINEVHGHLVGDEVLRRAGHALRHAMRPYDLAARYGGDEFALVAVDADEDTASDVAARALSRLGEAIEELVPEGGTVATAGVAQWSPSVSAPELIARADRALLFAKQEGLRGGVHTFGGVPGHFRPGRFSREDRGLPEPPPMPERGEISREWPESRLDDRLRKRTRQLALASELGARLAAMTRAPEIREVAVAELRRMFGFEATFVDGALHVEPGTLDQDDQQLLETVAALVGSALRGALLYERLEGAYLGTAEALAAALEAKDEYTADHARSIVSQAEAVARRLGLSDDELRDLRFAAVFHDIGKVAIPEAILHKPGPLSADEREVMERHSLIGEEILAPVEFLEAVRRLVRHEHERWDGAGYPDGLAGEQIPLGSRIILVCDALHAMTSDRPYRRAMSLERAKAELRRHAGSQFDPAVVEALLAELDASPGPPDR
jgi:diguanylate cyclase (GGDEF)-like protein